MPFDGPPQRVLVGDGLFEPGFPDLGPVEACPERKRGTYRAVELFDANRRDGKADAGYGRPDYTFFAAKASFR